MADAPMMRISPELRAELIRLQAELTSSLKLKQPPSLLETSRVYAVARGGGVNVILSGKKRPRFPVEI